MGVDLELVVPENRKNDKKVIDDYYNFVLRKEKKMKPDILEEKLQTNLRYKSELKYFHKKGYVLLMERISSNVRQILDWQKIYELFGGLYEKDKTVIYGDKIKDLIKMLRDAKEELVEREKINEGTSDWTDWQKLELHPIALCEFALKNGFGIRLSE